jgi:hypothetical protein
MRFEAEGRTRNDAALRYGSSRENYSTRANMKKTTLERDRERHDAKLELVQEQVASGKLVIRQMTPTEQETWAAHSRKAEAKSTPEQRARRAAGLENRRKRAARLAPEPKR